MTEERRYRLHRKLEETLGDEEAATLMEHLPPFPWDKLALKEDLTREVDGLGEKIDARFDAFEEKTESRFDAFEAKIDGRFDAFEAKIDGRFGAIDGRFGALDEKLNGFVKVGDFHDKFDQLNNSIRMHSIALMTTSVALFGIAMTLR